MRCRTVTLESVSVQPVAPCLLCANGFWPTGKIWLHNSKWWWRGTLVLPASRLSLKTSLACWSCRWKIRECHILRQRLQVSLMPMNEWMRHLYSALLCIVVHPKRFTIIWGGLSSTTTSVQHPLGWCDGSHSTMAPVRSPHTSYRWRGERDRANQVDGDY